ncbi:hypothetical protein BC936DRAFT_149023 [Jimgerdemannia flammicorona]|uniref:Derlin n=1 Tax=Jimgerdemannia flammicorona TaxID=994334 RepID=A0A433D1Q9_9FUNG|nr:hypothetical protein BC936DRAFT_149023 [Jimgerdemannia flammicorona]
MNRPQNELLNGLRDWYNTVPPITRTLFMATLGLSVLGGLRLVNPYFLVLVWPDAITKFQVWRLFTSFFFHKLGFAFVMNLYFLYQYSQDLETQAFGNRTADYLFFVLFVMGLELIASYFLSLFLLGDALMLALVYVWSQHFRHKIVSFLFGFTFKAVYLPWVLVAYDILLGSGIPTGLIVGIVTGHTYWFLDSVYPAAGGPRLLRTPQLLYRFFPQVRGGYTMGGGVEAIPGRAAQQAAAATGGYSWGRGQRLGT